jgi:acyl carrier protein
MVAEKVIEIVAAKRRIPPEQVALDKTFQELGIDSLSGIAIVYALEEEFNVTIPDEDAREIQTVGEVIEKLEKHLGAGGAASPGAG